MGPITAEWLAEIGFKHHQFDRQPDKHWLLWIGWAMEEGSIDAEDIGVEVAPSFDGKWHCWFRSDAGGRYGRFLHLRYLRWREELTEIIAALVGRPFDPDHAFYGSLHTPERAARLAAPVLDWQPADQEPALDTLAILLFAESPHVGLAVWRGRCRFSFNGWWQDGSDLLVSLPIRRSPIYWTPFVGPKLDAPRG